MEKSSKKIFKEYTEFLSRIVVGIGETSEITGVPIRKLRYWVDKGIIQSVGGTKIKFDLSNIRKIISVQEFLSEGYTLDAAAKKIKERHDKMMNIIKRLDFD